MTSILKRQFFWHRYSYADIATVVFAVIVAYDFIFGFKIQAESKTIMELAVGFVFMNTVHILYPLWMMHRSPEYRLLIEDNLGSVKHVKWGLGVVFFLMSVMCFAVTFAGTKQQSDILYYVFVVWSVWHYLSQTRGLVLNSFTPEARITKAILNILNLMVVCLLLGRAFRLYAFTFAQGSFGHALSTVGAGFQVIAGICVVLLFILFYYRKNRFSSQHMILSRFVFWVINIITPVSAYAVNAIHGSEYYDLTRNVERRSPDWKTHRNFIIGAFTFFLIYVAIDLLYIIKYFPKDGLIYRAISAYGLAINMTHYLLDTYIYRRRTPRAAAIMKEFTKRSVDNVASA